MQRVRQIVGIVRQRLQVFALDHQLRGVVVRLHAERRAGFALHHDFLLFRLHRQLNGNLHRAAGADRHLLEERLETGKRQAHGVIAGRQSGERVRAVGLRLHRFGHSISSQGDARGGNHAAGIVGQRALYRTRRWLGQRSSRNQRDGENRYHYPSQIEHTSSIIFSSFTSRRTQCPFLRTGLRPEPRAVWR